MADDLRGDDTMDELCGILMRAGDHRIDDIPFKRLAAVDPTGEAISMHARAKSKKRGALAEFAKAVCAVRELEKVIGKAQP